MQTFRRTPICASAAAMAVVLSLAGAQPALAASATDAAAASEASASGAAGESGPGLEIITVTAQKRTENLQETPISISVMSSQALQDRHVTSILDLGEGAVPSLTIAPFFSRPGALVVNIRGVGVLSDSNQPARDQGVGVYVDGVYLGRAQGLGTALFDIDNIEVLKGPQGTLFGRNTEGGALNIVTKKPLGEFRLNATAGVGNYGSHKAEVHLDLPSFANIALKVDAVIAKRDPFVANPLPGALGFNSFDKRGIHVEALWRPSDTFKADLSYDASYDATSTLYQQEISAGTGLPTSASGSSAIPPNTTAAIFKLQPTRAYTSVVGVPQQPCEGHAHGVSLTMEWKATPDLTLRSITAYRTMRQSQFDNGSAAPNLQRATPLPPASPPNFLNFGFARYSLADFAQHQFSQEVQLIGDLPRLKFVGGALYYRENVADDAVALNTDLFTDAAGSTYTFPATLSAFPFTTDLNAIYANNLFQRASKVITTSTGVFGQATWTPAIANDMVHLTGGLRWSHDKKEGQLYIVNGAAPILPTPTGNVQAPIQLNRSWSRVDPMVNLAIDLSRDVHVYGKWSTGYRSGGTNSRSTSYAQFSPETVSMFEIGAKTELLDHHVRFNVAGYVGTYKNIQLDFSGIYQFLDANGQLVATTRTTTDTVNAPGTGHLKGVELELAVAPFDGLTMTASYSYNSVKIPNTLNPFPQSIGGGQVALITVPIPIYQPYTPVHSASASIDYETPIGNALIKLHLDANYDSGYYAGYVDSDYDSVTRAVRFAQPKGDSGLVFNGRIALANIPVGSTGAKVTFAVWARNLFNEEHDFLKFGTAASGIQGFFNDPRTFGGEINIKM